MCLLICSLFTALVLSTSVEAADPILFSKAKDLTFQDKSWKDCVHALARNLKAKVFPDNAKTWFAIDKTFGSGYGLDLDGFAVHIGVSELPKDSDRVQARYFIKFRVNFEANAVCRVRLESKKPYAFLNAAGRDLKGLPPILIVD